MGVFLLLQYTDLMQNGLFDLKRWWHLLHSSRFVHFFVVGSTGVAMNLLITGTLTEFIFGREQYFTGYVIGLTANLLYNFVLHTLITFKTKKDHTRRLVIFAVYSLAMVYIQAQVVKAATAVVGVNFYLIVIASVILISSIITFVLFKFVLFKPEQGEESMV